MNTKADLFPFNVLFLLGWWGFLLTLLPIIRGFSYIGMTRAHLRSQYSAKTYFFLEDVKKPTIFSTKEHPSHGYHETIGFSHEYFHMSNLHCCYFQDLKIELNRPGIYIFIYIYTLAAIKH